MNRDLLLDTVAWLEAAHRRDLSAQLALASTVDGPDLIRSLTALTLGALEAATNGHVPEHLAYLRRMAETLGYAEGASR